MQLARKRWRAGRKRKEGARHPGGQLVQNVGATTELLQRRAEIVGAANIYDGDASWLIGRLYLKGILTEGQRDAAKKWQGRTARYKLLLEGPRPPRAADLGMPMGQVPDDPEEFQRAKFEYDQCWHAVSARGHRVLRATLAAIFDETVTDISLVMEGLTALAKALGIDENTKKC